MIRVTDAVFIVAVIAGAVWTYQVKHDADQTARHLKSLRAQIVAEERKIALLEADWALATDPARLESIAKRYEAELGLIAADSDRIATLSELPDFIVVEEETLAEESDGRTVITGGIASLLERSERLGQ